MVTDEQLTEATTVVESYLAEHYRDFPARSTKLSDLQTKAYGLQMALEFRTDISSLIDIAEDLPVAREACCQLLENSDEPVVNHQDDTCNPLGGPLPLADKQRLIKFFVSLARNPKPRKPKGAPSKQLFQLKVALAVSKATDIGLPAYNNNEDSPGHKKTACYVVWQALNKHNRITHDSVVKIWKKYKR